MSQHDYNIANQIMSAARSDINSALGAIQTNNSGAAEPGTMAAYLWWADTTSGFMKIRNAANNAWVSLFVLASQGLIAQNGASVYAADAGATDAYAITLSPAPTALTTGMVIRFKANTANTGACTLNVNALGAIAIKKNKDEDLADNDIKAGQDVEVMYDGTNFQLLSPVCTLLELADVGVSVQAYDANTVKKNAVNNFTKQQYFGTATLTDGASIAWDLDNAQAAKVTLAGNRALANPTNMKDGASYILRVIQDATGSRTLSYGSAYKWANGSAPTLSTGANDVDLLTFISDGTNMYGTIVKDFS